MDKDVNTYGLLFSVAGGRMSPVGKLRRIDLAAADAVRFDLASGGCWYGHGFAHRQPYPLNEEPVVNEALAVNNIQSPMWMCSAGYAILAETAEALSVRCNAGGDGILEVRCDSSPMTVRIFHGRHLPEAHKALMSHLGWPNATPQGPVLGDSIFCTWTQYPRCITQARILDMAAAIRRHGYPCSILTIDDRWESAFGEMTFSRDFPDPRAMVYELHAMGFRALLWVTPFVNREARTFGELADRGVLVKRKDGAGPAMLRWWGGTAGLVDLTGRDGFEWYRSQMVRLRREYGIDGFKIDGGDAKYQPPPAEALWADYKGPSGYADELLRLFEEISPGMCETRTAWLSQRRNILWRQGGKDSHWGADNGLAALVHLGLHTALMGYDVQMPDMVPGRVQTMAANAPLPTDELMVRWTEASAFFPILQFSYFPWNYAEATASVVRSYAIVHETLGPYIRRQAAKRAAPLLRPIWYDSPGEQALYPVGDEFCLGGDLLAAPVLAPSQAARDVLLPPGKWLDAWTGESRDGGFLPQYPAPCPGIPVFVRQENSRLFSRLHAKLKEIPRGIIPPAVTTSTYAAGIDRDLNVTG